MNSRLELYLIDMFQRSSGYSTGKWSDDDDIHPTITPVFGPNR